MHKTWTEGEKSFIIENALNMTDTELYAALQRMGATHSLASVRKFRQRNGFAKSPGRPPKIKSLQSPDVTVEITDYNADVLSDIQPNSEQGE